MFERLVLCNAGEEVDNALQADAVGGQVKVSEVAVGGEGAPKALGAVVVHAVSGEVQHAQTVVLLKAEINNIV